jgi:small subunit ribosomal protein S3
MGQKVNPKGLRLGVTQNWNSRWFFTNKKRYREALLSDMKIRNALMNKFKFASVTQVDIERAINKITVILYSVKPGMIIGRGGKGLEEVKRLIMKELKLTNKNKETKVDFKIEPVKKPYLNAFYVAQTISEKLIKGFPHRAVVHNAINRVIESGGKGVKIQLSGRIGGAEISRREKYFQGTIPTSTIREDVDYARFPALTRSGYIGVKVWICR